MAIEPGRRRAVLAGVVLGVVCGACFGRWAPRRDHPEDAFGNDGPLYCSGVLGLPPVDAAPLLDAMGFEATWDTRPMDGAGGGMTRTPPRSGYIIGGTADWIRLVLTVGDDAARSDPCELRHGPP